MQNALRNTLFAPACVAVLTLAAAGCGNHSGADEPEPRAAISVSLATTQYRGHTTQVTRPGRTEPTQVVPLLFLDGGRVEAVPVDENQHVRAGQRLAWVDTTEFHAHVAKARVAVDKARRDHERARRLAEDAAIPRSNVEDARSALDVARSNLRIAEHHLRNATLRAPTDGFIVKRNVEPGQLIGNSSPALILMVLDPIIVVLGVVDDDLVHIARGDTAVVRLNALPDFSREGRVSRMGLVAAADGTFPVEISLPNSDLTLRAGMIAQVTVRASEEQRTLMVPAEAVVIGDGKQPRVFVYDPETGMVRGREVLTSPPRDGWVPVFQGLGPRDRVVVHGARQVRDGARVIVREHSDTGR